MGIIYKAENIENGKVYIGQTNRTLEERIYRHIQSKYYEPKEDEEDMTFPEILNFYGEDCFIFEKIDESNSDTELNEKEKYWIEYYDSTNNKFGYNINKGGRGYKTPMYFDGSENEKAFLYNNTAIKYNENTVTYKGNIKNIKCPNCNSINELRVDIFSNPLIIVSGKKNSEYYKKCKKCKKYLYENLTEYRDRYINKESEK